MYFKNCCQIIFFDSKHEIILHFWFKVEFNFLWFDWMCFHNEINWMFAVYSLRKWTNFLLSQIQSMIVCVCKISPTTALKLPTLRENNSFQHRFLLYWQQILTLIDVKLLVYTNLLSSVTGNIRDKFTIEGINNPPFTGK